MKINELKQYKALDITQLSGSPWNTAEKVLGLDENDKVVMAEPEEAVTPEYVENAIDQAMEAETARTESTYLKEHQSLEDYATKDYVDQAIADVDVSDQLVNYALKTGVTQDIASATAYTMDQVEAKGYVTEQDLGDYAKTTAVTADIAAAMANETARTESTYAKPSDIPSLDGYAKTTAVTQDIQTAMAAETARTEDTYMKIGDVPSLDGYWTSAQTESAITQSIAAETARTENTYAKPGDIPSLDGYATEAYVTAATQDMATKTWVGEQGYLTEHQDLSGYALTTAVTEDIQAAIASETARTEDAYVTKTGLGNTVITGLKPDSDGRYLRYTSRNVSAATSNNYNIFFKTINGSGIVGGSDDISLPTFSDVSTAITQAIETETGRTESTYAKISDIPSLTGYATEAYVDSAVTASTAATTGWVESQGYLTEHQDISGKLDVSTFNTYTGATATVLDGKADVSDIPDVSGFVTSGDVATQIGTAMAAETARTESTYLKEHQDISGKLDVSTFNTYTGATETALEGKVDLATYTAYTGSTATAIAAKQDTLVSGTNIKTINNQSLLGSGNIDIQGGGGGSVVELTQAQYDALDPPAQDTTYIITDAETVDLNDYAMASGLTELSGTVETISSNYATKQNVTARASSNTNPYLPGWNSEGVITGASQVHSVGMSINGSNQAGLLRGSNSNLPSFYAPTSAGTAGQPLLSNGSGAPQWAPVSFSFLSQSQYDALTTKDQNCIYFIISDS